VDLILAIGAIWTFATLIILLILCWITVKVFWVGVQVKKRAEKYAETIKLRTDRQYNKYASLTIMELEPILRAAYSQQLALASALAVTIKDPNAVDLLYTKSVDGLLVYLGQETIDALNYYYGDGFILRWCETQFKLLENEGIISEIIAKTIKSAQIERTMKQ